jgi:hypothetical protein
VSNLVPVLQLVVRSNQTLSLDYGERAQSKATFSSFKDAAWYIGKYYPQDKGHIPVRANGHTAVVRWLSDGYTLMGVHLVLA